MDLLRFRTETEWVQAARTAFLEAAAAAAARGSSALRLCLAGGRTPETVYRALAQSPLRDIRVQLWLGDERDVPPGSPDRNGNLILRAFENPVWNPEPEFLLWPADPADAACRLIEARLAALEEPFFDLSFLGIGEDGHTAGIFPGGPEAEETSRLAVPSRAPAEPRARMTLTPRALASTRGLCFLLRGPAKLGLAERIGKIPVPGASDQSQPLLGEGGGREPVPAELVARRVRASGASVALLYCET